MNKSMDVFRKAKEMLEKHPLCNHCLGRQFALLGHDMENHERGEAMKAALVLEAHALVLSKRKEGERILGILATNGFSEAAKEVMRKTKKRLKRKYMPKTCFLCENRFKIVNELVEKAVRMLRKYECRNFLVGIQLPVVVEEREDDFKAEFEVTYGENIRNEFGRIIGKEIADRVRKGVEYKKPDVVVLVNPFKEETKIQVNPLYVAGCYRKVARGIPQSRWYCSSCRGKGCEKCDWTGTMYSESVEEIIEKPFLDATTGIKASFHASGREDIDARMLGKGRCFVVEIVEPRKRFLDLEKIEKAVNVHGKGKVEVSDLHFADRDVVRRLKKADSREKEYRVVIEFEDPISGGDLRLLEEKLTNNMIRQRTPIRVSHRRADLTREKYIYEVKVKKLSPKAAEMRIRCQGGLYVKELVTGDCGRTEPSVSGILKSKAEPIELDVLSVIMND